MDDLISRQAAIEAIRNEREWLDENTKDTQHHYHMVNETARILFLIGELPSIQPKEKTGHWIPINPLLTAARCSECKSALAEKTNFCPYCGARMESEDNENE